MSDVQVDGERSDVGGADADPLAAPPVSVVDLVDVAVDGPAVEEDPVDGPARQDADSGTHHAATEVVAER